MPIYIDPPLWPAHGTEFSHLISDSSLKELHAFAERAGISRRAFDEDHYDVPADRYAALVALGARAVDGGTLVRALIGSGLRLPARTRPAQRRSALTKRWNGLLPDCPATGEDLVERWSQPHRRYHTTEHLLDVLEALDKLFDADDDGTCRRVRLAAWFHDAVYDGAPGVDEERSARLAEDRLAGMLPQADIHEVSRLVRLTVTHAAASKDRAGALLCDADLAVLGRSPSGYARYVEAVRSEYAHVPDGAFAAGRAAVVRRLLAADPLYRTDRARELWAERAIANLAGELS